MCGRYMFMLEKNDEIIELLEQLEAETYERKVKTGEIRPTDQALILISTDQGIIPAAGIWGFPQFNGKGVLINARSETAFEKKTFRDSMIDRRCIVPSTGFYEWDAGKRQYLFNMEGDKVLYLAGLYNFYKGELRYVVLTTEANESVREIHDRMPVIIPRQEITAWLTDQQASAELMRRTPPQLAKTVKSSGKGTGRGNYGQQYRMDLWP
ncbi:putative SOS response-associated peptidase YedK [Anaerotaenia torta]|uniref:SOS response-associated peptidase n=1 Tax=Anaerotaenia torta TaxID=433293 RepID=UPI003D1DEC3A